MHRGGRGQTFVYELAYQGKGDDGSPFVMNLLETNSLTSTESETTPINNPSVGEKKSGLNDNLSGQAANLSGSNRGHIAPISGGIRGDENGDSQDTAKDAGKIEDNTEKRTHRAPKNNATISLPDVALPDNPSLAALRQAVQRQQG